MRIVSIIAIAFLGISSIAETVFAHDPQLNSALPTGGQRGTSVNLRCLGNRLQNAKTILFYKPGITVGKPDIKNAKEIIFPLTIAADAPLGEYLFRVHCDGGISYVSSFWVGNFPEITEKKEANNSIAEAQSILLNQTVNGVSANEDVDYYKVTLKKDQIISAELVGMRLGRTFYDPHLSLTDSSNKELISSDDSLLHKQDPSLTYKAPSDGDYYLIVREASYQGSNNSHYRLQVGNFIIPKSIFPLGAQRGKETDFRVLTENTPAFSYKQKFTTAEALQPLLVTKDNLVTNSPQFIRVTDFGYYNETNPNDSPGKSSQKMIPEAPFAFHGTIEKDGDQDWYKFKAKKGQKLTAKVYAQSLASPLDSVLQFRHADGKYISNNDDQSQGLPDSKLDFNVPADGEYWVMIMDQLKSSSPHHHYRIELTHQKPSVKAEMMHVRIQETQKWKALNIPQGNKVCYQVTLTKKGIKEEMKVLAKQLPKGVKMRQLNLVKNDNKAVIYLEATANAPKAAGLFPLSAATPDNKMVEPVQTSVYPFLGSNNKVFTGYVTDKIPIAVTDSAPAQIEIIQPPQPIVRSGTMAITVRVKRAEGFDGKIDLQMPWKPAGIGTNYSANIPKGKDQVTIYLAADSNAPLGKWDFCIRAMLYPKDGPVQLSSNVIQVEVKEPYLSGKLAMAATTQGKNTSILCTLDQHTAFEGKVKITLHGLPDGITAQPVEVTKDDKEIAIPITVPANARIGKHANLFCRLNIPQGKLIIPHTIGQGGTLRVNRPPKKKVADNKEKPKPPAKEKPKKPLSRLEELRQK